MFLPCPENTGTGCREKCCCHWQHYVFGKGREGEAGNLLLTFPWCEIVVEMPVFLTTSFNSTLPFDLQAEKVAFALAVLSTMQKHLGSCSRNRSTALEMYTVVSTSACLPCSGWGRDTSHVKYPAGYPAALGARGLC